MQNPLRFKPDQPVCTVGHIGNTPIAVQGANWLPANQLIFWSLFAWLSKRTHPAWSGLQLFLAGGLKMVVFLGSEWCHNLAHVAAARAIGKPVDALRIILGMPVLIYDEPEHSSITPRQHLIRSLAGPVCNSVLLLASKLFQRSTRQGSVAREIADVAVGMNTFIACGSLIPIEAFDGGPILKWSLIARGFSPVQAQKITAQTSRAIGVCLVGAALVSIQFQAFFVETCLPRLVNWLAAEYDL
jgi:Zn-dependent protease